MSCWQGFKIIEVRGAGGIKLSGFAGLPTGRFAEPLLTCACGTLDWPPGQALDWPPGQALDWPQGRLAQAVHGSPPLLRGALQNTQDRQAGCRRVGCKRGAGSGEP
jgi:hypothetical protein